MRRLLLCLASLCSALVALIFGSSSAFAVTGPEAVARAQQWVDAQLPYCQCPNHESDKHGVCNREDNGFWDAYRTDCSGLVSWAWNLPAPGLTTKTLWDVATIIDAADLQPGDAIDSADHTMLFAGWTHFPDVANLIDEHDWGTVARRQDFDVAISGSSFIRQDWKANPFTAIRYNGLTAACPSTCDGSSIVNPDCSRSDCGAFGSSCVDDSLGARCVSFACPATGAKDVCIPNTEKMARCSNGAVTEVGDCGVFGSICSTDGSLHCIAPYAATLYGKAPDDGTTFCVGDAVDLRFDLRNDGYLPWTDTGADAAGHEVRLGTSDGTKKNFADPLTGLYRASVKDNDNADVQATGADCSNASGCRRSIFHLRGTASKAGKYTESWQLLDEDRAWFGPIVTLDVTVKSCGKSTSDGSALSPTTIPTVGDESDVDGPPAVDTSDAPSVVLPGKKAANAAPTASTEPSGCSIGHVGSTSSSGAAFVLAAIGLALLRRVRKGAASLVTG